MRISVEHIGLPARNPAELADWYLNTLGGTLTLKTDSAFFVQLDGAMLEIYEGDFALRETGDNKCNGFRHLALQVDSIETAKKELEQRGVRFREDVKPAGGGGRVLFFTDCEGNLLHLVERPAGSMFAKQEN